MKSRLQGKHVETRILRVERLKQEGYGSMEKSQRIDGKPTKGGLYEEPYGSLLYHTIQLKYNWRDKRIHVT